MLLFNPNKADFRETYKAIEFCISIRFLWRIHSNISKNETQYTKSKQADFHWMHSNAAARLFEFNFK